MSKRDRKVRTYVLYPCKEVRDHATGLGTCDVKAVLDGKIDAFLTASIRLRAQERMR